MKGDYIIIGDTNEFKDCLVCVAGSTSERANELLNRMLNNPTDNDKRIMSGHTNFRIKFVEADNCWWNGYLD